MKNLYVSGLLMLGLFILFGCSTLGKSDNLETNQNGLNATYYSFGEYGDSKIDYTEDISTCIEKQKSTDYSINFYPEFWPFEFDHAFAVEWNAFLKIPETNNYIFALLSDDRSYLSIDGNQVIDTNGTVNKDIESTPIKLKKGFHQINIKYFSNGDTIPLYSSGNAAYIVLKWKENGENELIPIENSYFRIME